MELADILRRAEELGISDGEIATIAKRDPATIWRWRNAPPKSLIYDSGVRSLIQRLESGRIEKGDNQTSARERFE